MKKLRPASLEAIANTSKLLQSDFDAASDYFNEKSEAWQDSDAGTSYQEWLESLEGLIEALDSIPYSPG